MPKHPYLLRQEAAIKAYHPKEPLPPLVIQQPVHEKNPDGTWRGYPPVDWSKPWDESQVLPGTRPKPGQDFLPSDPGLITLMDQVRALCSRGHAIRVELGVPLATEIPRLQVYTETFQLNLMEELIAGELNVSEVDVLPLTDAHVRVRLIIQPKVLGPRVGRAVQDVIRASKAGDWYEDTDGVVCGSVRLAEGEYELDREGTDANGNVLRYVMEDK